MCRWLFSAREIFRSPICWQLCTHSWLASSSRLFADIHRKWALTLSCFTSSKTTSKPVSLTTCLFFSAAHARYSAPSTTSRLPGEVQLHNVDLGAVGQQLLGDGDPSAASCPVSSHIKGGYRVTGPDHYIIQGSGGQLVAHKSRNKLSGGRPPPICGDCDSVLSRLSTYAGTVRRRSIYGYRAKSSCNQL